MAQLIRWCSICGSRDLSNIGLGQLQCTQCGYVHNLSDHTLTEGDLQKFTRDGRHLARQKDRADRAQQKIDDDVTNRAVSGSTKHDKAALAKVIKDFVDGKLVK